MEMEATAGVRTSAVTEEACGAMAEMGICAMYAKCSTTTKQEMYVYTFRETKNQDFTAKESKCNAAQVIGTPCNKVPIASRAAASPLYCPPSVVLPSMMAG
jgi:hypothetical protein